MLLNLAGRSKLVERALGHPREDVDHGINTILLISVGKAHHLDAKGEEGSIKESVQEEHLTCKIVPFKLAVVQQCKL